MCESSAFLKLSISNEKTNKQKNVPECVGESHSAIFSMRYILISAGDELFKKSGQRSVCYPFHVHVRRAVNEKAAVKSKLRPL